MNNNGHNPSEPNNGRHRVVIVGAGFGGLAAMRRLARAGVQTTLVDRNIYSTFQPLLYEVASASLASSDVAYPVRNLARKYHAAFRHGELASITPPITIPAWACAMTGKTPGQLAIYGMRNRKDTTYEGLSIATSLSVQEPTVWDLLGERGGRHEPAPVAPPRQRHARTDGERDLSLELRPIRLATFARQRAELRDERVILRLELEVGRFGAGVAVTHVLILGFHAGA